tara:strand:- start:116 stop:418 length:303 start_codon:yes stop_codon:yes gene_type:complete
VLHFWSALALIRGKCGVIRKISATSRNIMSVARVAIGLVVILAIVAYSAYSVITTGQVLGIDARLFLVVAPVLAAVGWAAFNIGRAAVGQLQLMIQRSRA